jgi:hypothetical protein
MITNACEAQGFMESKGYEALDNMGASTINNSNNSNINCNNSSNNCNTTIYNHNMTLKHDGNNNSGIVRRGISLSDLLGGKPQATATSNNINNNSGYNNSNISGNNSNDNSKALPKAFVEWSGSGLPSDPLSTAVFDSPVRANNQELLCRAESMPIPISSPDTSPSNSYNTTFQKSPSSWSEKCNRVVSHCLNCSLPFICEFKQDINFCSIDCDTSYYWFTQRPSKASLVDTIFNNFPAMDDISK